MPKLSLLTALVLIAAMSSVAQEPAQAGPVTEPFVLDVDTFHIEGTVLRPEGDGPFPAVVYVWGAGPTRAERMAESSRMVRELVDAGYAVLLYDKPGSGGSTGTFTPGQLFHERAEIATAAIAALAEHPRVHAERIGLYGSSQAAYVVPLILRSAPESIAFLIAWSFPMESSIEQSGYLVEQYLLCAGFSKEAAHTAYEAYRTRGLASTYEAYAEAATALDAIPEIRDELGWAGVRSEERFRPITEDSESLLDPGVELGGLSIPALVIYGELDRNIDPDQGAAVFRRLLEHSGSPLSKLIVIEGVDHNMRHSPDGCVQHQLQGYEDLEDSAISEEFYTAVVEWVTTLRGDWSHAGAVASR